MIALEHALIITGIILGAPIGLFVAFGLIVLIAQVFAMLLIPWAILFSVLGVFEPYMSWYTNVGCVLPVMAFFGEYEARMRKLTKAVAYSKASKGSEEYLAFERRYRGSLSAIWESEN